MDLSVIVPTYRRKGAVISVLQGYWETVVACAVKRHLNIELIVVDDGSQDGTSELIIDFINQKPECRLLTLDSNLGPGPARNAGVAVATGTWVWFLDDDDSLQPEGVNQLFGVLFDTEDNSLDVCAHSLRGSYDDDKRPAQQCLLENVLLFREKAEVFNYLFRRSMLERHGISFSAQLHEDIRYVAEMILKARKLNILSSQVVDKQSGSQAITARMNEPRIDGYIQSFDEVSNLLRKGLVSEPQILGRIAEQCLGVVLYLIAAESDEVAEKLLDYLVKSTHKVDSWRSAITKLPKYETNDTNFKYAGSLWREKLSLGCSPAEILPDLRLVFSTRVSCKDLDESLFLGPDEIRACCKRFFVDGERKGDVVLLPASEGIQLQDIQKAKDRLIAEINRDESQECAGCPYLERRPIDGNRISYISFENFAYCNMRCVYCSPKYYGGTEAAYNAREIIDQLTLSETQLSEDCHVVWGGGEPTLSPYFSAINENLLSQNEIAKVRILSNSLKFSPVLFELLKDGRTCLVTSIDAGSQELFKEIRGKGDIQVVLNNLAKYASAMSDQRRLTIKYILREDNCSTEELVLFVNAVKEAGLMGCLFQVSCDFNIYTPDAKLVAAIYELSVRLFEAGAAFVFLDDLIRDRLVLRDASADSVLDWLAESDLGLEHLSFCRESPIVLWGKGKQSEWYLTDSVSSRSEKILGVVQDKTEYEALASGVDSLPEICPAGVQSVYEILIAIEKAGFEQQIFRGVVL